MSIELFCVSYCVPLDCKIVGIKVSKQYITSILRAELEDGCSTFLQSFNITCLITRCYNKIRHYRENLKANEVFFEESVLHNNRCKNLKLKIVL
jgi:hypothetical protein